MPVSGKQWVVMLGVAPILLALAVPAAAQDSVSHLFLGGGVYNIDGDNEGNSKVPAFELEWRPGARYLEGFVPATSIAPFVGGFVTTERTAFGGFGFGIEVAPFNSLVLFPFTGVGLYNRGDGRDLGHPVEFRSGVEAGYRFSNGIQVAVSFFHLSNAGISETNPGIELLTLRFGAPLRWLLRD